MKRFAACLLVAVGAVACSPDDDSTTFDYGRDVVDESSLPTDDGWTPTEVPETPDMFGLDLDGDGFSPADGDCDDTEPRINPAAFEVPGNLRDDDCDGAMDEDEGCDCHAEPNLPDGLDLCDSRFLVSWEERCFAPACGSGAGTLTRFGDPGNDLGPRFGCAYTLLGTAPLDIALCNPEYCPGGRRQPGTDYYESGWFATCETESHETDPSPSGPDSALICDTHQLVLNFRAPRNAVGFSFDFVYLSTEYPEWVDEGFNDTFYAIVDRPAAGERRNISFDEAGHEIEIDNAFFENPPVTNISGTGYDGTCTNEDFSRTVCGSSTGWLRTSWEVEPGEEFTLTFSIHDEGDGIYDSTVILDNFQWSPDPVDPGTVII